MTNAATCVPDQVGFTVVIDTVYAAGQSRADASVAWHPEVDVVTGFG